MPLANTPAVRYSGRVPAVGGREQAGRRWPTPDVLQSIALLTVFGLLGGSSRSDVLTQIAVRLAAVLALAVVAWRGRWAELIPIRRFALLLGMVATLPAVQLLPLPPKHWAALPGHGALASALSSDGLDRIWRPLSLAPDLTLNSLLACLPMLAAALLIGPVDRSRRGPLVVTLLCLIGTGALISAFEVGGGVGYLYRITNHGVATGVFANRNHWALLLACAFPLIALWTRRPGQEMPTTPARQLIGLAMATSVFPLILITGSRAGLVLALGSSAAALSLALRGGRRERRWTWPALTAVALPFVGGIGALLLSFAAGRDIAFQRLVTGNGQSETRIVNLPAVLDLARAYLPTGAGFGTFDPVFRQVEPLSSLEPTYLNHAHNDLIEIIIEGGVPAAVLLLAALLWFGWLAWRAWLSIPAGPDRTWARASSIMLAAMLLASLVDYPLRTPFLSALFAVFACWLEADVRRAAAQSVLGRSAGLDYPATREL